MGQHSLPADLFRPEQVRELDRIAIQERGIPGYALMSRAGLAAFDALSMCWPEARRILVVCGGGNNAGDGYVIARLAAQAGLRVELAYLVEPASLRGDAAQAWRDARAQGLQAHPFSAEALWDVDLIVDAILGTGLERDVRGNWAAAIAALNAMDVPVLAVDVPSGLSAATGEVLGCALRADCTITFIGLKQGLFTGRGPEFCGRVLFDGLDVPADIYRQVPPSATRYHGQDAGQLLPRRSRDAHKGQAGHVLVIGGDYGMAGAARMAGEAAGRVGAGLVSVATRNEHALSQAAARPELMFAGTERARDLEPLLAQATVAAIGPGLGRGDWGSTMWRAVLTSDLPLVVDADALNLLALAGTERRENWILTPHPGEAARLIDRAVGQIQANRFEAARALQTRYGGVTVLKGAGTVVQSGEDAPYVCAVGNPGMASGGMGDVLTGVIAGLVAQGLALPAAARLGVHVHGAAGDLAAAGGERGLLAGDLLAELRGLVNPG